MNVTILNMSDDTNKGDFAILENTVRLTRARWPEAVVRVLNVDYDQQFIDREDKFRRLKSTGVAHYGSFFPKVHSGRRKCLELIRALAHGIFSIWILLAACLGGKKAGSLMPGSKKQSFSAISEADLVLMKGGSYIFAFGGIGQVLYIYRMLLALMIALILKKRVIVLGQSIGPIKGWPARYLAGACLARCEKIVLRENISYEYLITHFQIPEEKLEVWPDLVFWNDKPPAKLPPSESRHKIRIGFTFRQWAFPEEETGAGRRRLARDYEAVMVGLIERLAAESREVSVILHTLEDRAISDRIVSKAAAVRYYNQDYSVGELKSIYSDLDILIGTRTHSCIFALSVGTPVVAVAYQKHKGFGIMEMVEEGAFVEDIYNFRGDKVLAIIEQIINDYPCLKNAVETRVNRLNAEISDKFSSL
ncbi:MAG: polysaccharide pyruvyl transferase family protein [Candidatus Erginobacter occultus]|nr:polysaccharide pyruvyl transferase family protein [Candidatus Erginobacter occultus]